MCGIIGYIGNKPATKILIEGLRTLEYRGYDSAGIALHSDRLQTFKRVGKVNELASLPLNSTASLGIAHTRWATHGSPTERNAHPHTDCNKEIAIVHNGIIENYHELKQLLIAEGHHFNSDTDSEVLAHLIEKFYNEDLENAVVQALNLVEGAYGVAVIHKDHNKIIAARKGSPLVIGIGDDENLVASDVSALLKHTRKVIYLDDDQLATLTPTSYNVKNLKGATINPIIHDIKWTVEEISKSGYKHFMLKEIFTQPEAIRNTLRGRIKDGKIKLTVDIPTNLRRIIITACGTSWHSALIGKYLIETLTNIPVEVDYASEFRYRDPIVSDQDIVVAISQSGETADTLAAIKEAKLKGAKTLGIVNVVGSTVTREVDSGIYLHAGPEIGVASTKAFTCQLTSLILLGLYIRQSQGKSLDPKLLHELTLIPEKIEQALEHSSDLRTIAQLLNQPNFLYLGRGLNFPVALEGALKLKEISYIHAEGYPAAEMKHGPIALIDDNTPTVFVAPDDQTFEKTLANIEEIRARNGQILTITTTNHPKLHDLSTYTYTVPKTHPLLQPLLTVIPLQLFAYHVADLKGLDVDKPRNLAKSVTVE